MGANERDLIARSAKRPDLEPLLTELRTRGDRMFPVSLGGKTGVDSNPPEDALWTAVQVAAMDGELTDEQLRRCEQAVGAR